MRASLVLAVSRHAFTSRTSRLATTTVLSTRTPRIGLYRSLTTRPRWDPRDPSTPDTSPKPSSSSSDTQPKKEDSTPLPRSINPSSALLLLTIPHPPSAWPPKLEFASPLLALASRSLKSKGVVVNVVWDGLFKTTESFIGEDEEVYPARLYWPDGSSVSFERFSKETLISGEVGRAMNRKMDREKALSPDGLRADTENMKERREILVCTHGSRDCRCGDKGGELVVALRKEIETRGLEGVVKVVEVAHVGGHKYAANAILLPSLDMISNLSQEHVPHLLSWCLSGRDKRDDMWQHWRGRYGLTEVEQAGVWGGTSWAHGEERIAEKLGNTEDTATPTAKVRLKFKTYEGETKDVEADVGETLLAVGKREGLPAIEGVCGGKLECATCHVYIPSTAPIPEASEAELDMLGYALGYRDGESRLGCQICVTRELAEWAAGEQGVVSLPRY